MFRRLTTAWGTAEQEATNYGFAMTSARGIGLRSSVLKGALVDIGNWYRHAVAHQDGGTFMDLQIITDCGQFSSLEGLVIPYRVIDGKCAAKIETNLDPRNRDAISGGAERFFEMNAIMQGGVASLASTSYTKSGVWSAAVASPLMWQAPVGPDYVGPGGVLRCAEGFPPAPGAACP
mgnify:CR=1 FL=1